MTQALAGVAAAALLLALWLLGRPRPRRFQAELDDGRQVAALNRNRIERLRTVVMGRSLPEEKRGDWSVAPGRRLSPRERRLLLAQLAAAARGESQQRIAAMQACLHWGDRCVLPLLVRGRQDPDLRVAALAAEGLSRFRGRPGPLGSVRNVPPVGQPAMLPRNVSRTL